MSATGADSRVVRWLAALVAVVGLWIVLAPAILPGAEFVPTHVAVGCVVTAVGAGYLIALSRDPTAKLPSIWFVLVLGVLLFTGAVSTHEPGTAFFWSTVVASVSAIALGIGAIVWGSRFSAGSGERTTIFE